MATRRRKDIRVRYSADLGIEMIIAQRIYGIGIDGNVLTPITPALQPRIVAGVPIDRSRISPRYALACLPNPDNQNGQSETKTIVPFLPGTFDHLQHLREISNYSDGDFSVQSLTYFSEATL